MSQNLSLFILSATLTSEITSDAIVDCMEKFAASSNSRLSNLAKIFLQVLVHAGLLGLQVIISPKLKQPKPLLILTLGLSTVL